MKTKVLRNKFVMLTGCLSIEYSVVWYLPTENIGLIKIYNTSLQVLEEMLIFSHIIWGHDLFLKKIVASIKSASIKSILFVVTINILLNMLI